MVTLHDGQRMELSHLVWYHGSVHRISNAQFGIMMFDIERAALEWGFPGPDGHCPFSRMKVRITSQLVFQIHAQWYEAHSPKNGPTPWDIVAKTPKLEWTWSTWPAWVLRLQLSNEGWQWNSCRSVFVFGCCWNLYSLFWVDLFKVSSCTFDGNIRKSPPQLVEPLQDDWGVQPFPARVTQWPC